MSEGLIPHNLLVFPVRELTGGWYREVVERRGRLLEELMVKGGNGSLPVPGSTLEASVNGSAWVI